MRVRKATIDDMHALLAMGASMHAESPRYRDLDYSEEKMFNLLSRLLAHPQAGDIVVAENDDGVVGMFGFVVVEHFFGASKIAYDIGVYVMPSFRGSSAFPKMVKAFEDGAAALGAQEIQVSITTGVHYEKTSYAFGRLGYVECGTTLLKRVNNV